MQININFPKWHQIQDALYIPIICLSVASIAFGIFILLNKSDDWSGISDESQAQVREWVKEDPKTLEEVKLIIQNEGFVSQSNYRKIKGGVATRKLVKP